MLYGFHRRTGKADLALGEAVDLLREAGHDRARRRSRSSSWAATSSRVAGPSRSSRTSTTATTPRSRTTSAAPGRQLMDGKRHVYEAGDEAGPPHPRAPRPRGDARRRRVAASRAPPLAEPGAVGWRGASGRTRSAGRAQPTWQWSTDSRPSSSFARRRGPPGLVKEAVMARLPDDPDLGWLRKAAKRLRREHPEWRLHEAQRDLARHFGLHRLARPQAARRARPGLPAGARRGARAGGPGPRVPPAGLPHLQGRRPRAPPPGRRPRRRAPDRRRRPARRRPRRHGGPAPPPRRGPHEGDARGRALPVAAAGLPRVRPARTRALRGRHPRGSAPPARPRRRPRHRVPLARAAVAVHRPHRVLRRGRGRAGRPAAAPPRLRAGPPPPRAAAPTPTTARRSTTAASARTTATSSCSSSSGSGTGDGGPWKRRLGRAASPPPRCCRASWAGPSCAGMEARVELLVTHGADPTAPVEMYGVRAPSAYAAALAAGQRGGRGRPRAPRRRARATSDPRTAPSQPSSRANRSTRRPPAPRSSTGRASSRGRPSTATTWACGPRSPSAGTSTGWPGPTSPPTSPGRAPSTPLPRNGDLPTVALLLELGADLGVTDARFGATPRQWAEHEGHPELAAFLADREG